MGELTAIMLGVRLFMAAVENAPTIKEDIGALNSIILSLVAGKHPTPEQMALFTQLTVKLLAADLAAVGASGLLASKAETYHNVEKPDIDKQSP